MVSFKPALSNSGQNSKTSLHSQQFWSSWGIWEISRSQDTSLSAKKLLNSHYSRGYLEIWKTPKKSWAFLGFPYNRRFHCVRAPCFNNNRLLFHKYLQVGLSSSPNSVVLPELRRHPHVTFPLAKIVVRTDIRLFLQTGSFIA